MIDVFLTYCDGFTSLKIVLFFLVNIKHFLFSFCLVSSIAAVQWLVFLNLSPFFKSQNSFID